MSEKKDKLDFQSVSWLGRVIQLHHLFVFFFSEGEA